MSALQKEYHEGRMEPTAGMRLLISNRELLGGNSGEWKPGQTTDEYLEEVERDMGTDLDRKAGGGE